MTTRAMPASGPGLHAPINLVAAAGFTVTLLAALLPMSGVHLWVGLTYYSRWAYTDVGFAVVALATAMWMIHTHVRHSTALYVIVVCAVTVIGAECSYVFYAFHSPMSENDLASAIEVLAYPVAIATSTAGLFSALFSRRTVVAR
jgi:hypothetical protein